MNTSSPYIFTSEAVSEGHPDKVADLISDAILDAALAADPEAHVAAESFVGPDFAANLGEITARGFDLACTEQIARDVVKSIGYDRPEERFSYDTFTYISRLQGQSPDIAQGVNRGSEETQGAGDQGMMFGYATRETPELMPAPLVWSHRILDVFTAKRKSGEIEWLRPDSKAQVSVEYDASHRPTAIRDIVVSHQTTADVCDEEIARVLREVALNTLEPTGLLTSNTRILTNPTGRFVIGGPAGDSGLTGRKIVVDTYGGAAPHGGGAFSGKDPSKVDRSAAYYARYVAKNIVEAGIADRCMLEVSYAIGVAEPVSFYVDFHGTGHGCSESQVVELLKEGSIFDFRPGKICSALSLRNPQGWCYKDTTNGCHFGRSAFPWEKTDKAAALRAALGL